jgi:hypothetical protein
MNTAFQNLFGTPVWTIMVDDAQALNADLMRSGGLYKPRTNYFSLPGQGIQRLKRIVMEKSQEISELYKWEYPISFVKGRQNPIVKGQCDSPHNHTTARMVGVYYVKAEPGQGDILLHDPRCGTNWNEPQARTDNGKRLRTFHRITPVSGMLLLFPGYLVHSVEHNPTDEVRISVAIEVYTKQPDETDYLG